MAYDLKTAENGSEWDILADKVCGRETTLPFTISTAPIKAEMNPEQRHLAYLSLYKRAVRAATANVDAVEEGEAQISYNFAMTASCMALCPRTAESAQVKDDSGNEIGRVALNGTVLAGTALVKNQVEWDALRTSSTVLFDVLREIGVPPIKTPTEMNEKPQSKYNANY